MFPKMSDEQRKEALLKAQKVRKERSEVRKSLKEGKIHPLDVLSNRNLPDNGVISKMRVTYFLQSLPGIGSVKCQRLMEGIGIVQGRRLSGLTTRQYLELRDYLMENFRPGTESAEPQNTSELYDAEAL